LLVAAVFYVCFFSHLDALGLVGPDEPRYAAVARAMAESGDWVTPRLNGQPWFEKPALYYWGAAVAFRAFGVNEFAARLPSALAAALAALTLGWAAWRFYGVAAARAALLVFPTCVGMFGFARAATPDMLFTAALTVAMVAAFSTMGSPGHGRRPARIAAGVFGIFLGMATLAKGPAAIVLAGGSTGLWAVTTRRWRDALSLVHPLSIVFFCLTALPWYVLCAARNSDFVGTFLFAHNIERYLTPLFRHEQPFWFFGPVLLLGLLPWTVLLVGVARDAARVIGEQRWVNSPGLFFAGWAVFPVVFFSFSQSKLPGYVLPAVAPLALLLARSVARAIEEKGAFASWLSAGIGGTFAALAMSAGHWLRGLPPESGWADPKRVLTWVALGIVGGLVIALLGLLGRPGAALLAAAVLTAALIEGANRRILPQLDTYISPRAAARAGQIQLGAAENLSVYRLRRAWHYGLNFYLHRNLPEWTPQSPHPAWLYTSSAGLSELERMGTRFAVTEGSSPEALLVRVLGVPDTSGGGVAP
jgi:4-amino-4-deoxy-L-arabinose transferase-like glycosyltransferase